jgi:hypothetical protein
MMCRPVGLSDFIAVTAVQQIEASMNESNGNTRLAYILGVPLAEDAQRQWPQMGEVVRGRDLIASVEGNFPELTLEVGRRLNLNDDTIVVEWTCNWRRSLVPKRLHC